MENKIAVVGSGISGLFCAYRLAKNGLKVKVFEKDVLAGGRAPKAVRVISENHDSILSILRELSYTGLEKITLDKIAAYSKGKAMPFTKFVPLIYREKDLSIFNKLMRHLLCRILHVDIKELNRLQDYLASLDFSLESTDPGVEKLHRISVDEWLQNYSESLRNLILIPMLQITFETDFKKLSARTGVHLVADFFYIIWNGGYIVEGGPFTVTQEIIKNLRGTGNEIEFLSEVKEVRETGEGFEVIYEKSEEPWGERTEKTEKFRYVVLAVPLTTSSKILGKDFGITYTPTKSIYTKGELQGNLELAIGPDYEINFRVLYTVLKGEQYIFPINPESDVADISPLFKDSKYRVLGAENVPTAMPRIMPNAEIPSLEYEIDGIFLCGDFYYYSNIETAAKTGLMVADKIIYREKKSVS